MKKQVLFSLCLTASAAAFVTGCATKQSAEQQAAEQETIEMIQQEEQEIQNEVNAEPVVTPTEATPEVEAAPATEAPAAEPAKEELRPVVTPVHPQPVEYTVTSGDSISALAVRFNVRKADILALNPELRKDPNALKIGQKVKFPAGTDVTVKAKPRKAAAPAAAPAAKGATYTVKAGDVLGGIAIRHGVKVADIKKANNLKSDAIWVGQKLTIPGAKKAVEPAKKAPAKKAPAKKAEPKKTETKKAEPKVVAPAVEPVAEPVNEAPLPPPPVVEEPAMPESPDMGLPPPPPPVEAATPAEPQTFDYVVGENEDIVSIAFKWGVNPATIRALNNIDAAQGNAVAPGTTLRLPKAQE